MIEIGKDVTIEYGATITADSGKIGDRSIIRAGARIEGTHVEIGRESYLDYGAWIGGGSCTDKEAYLKAGDWLHMGWNSQINIARGVDIGDEVGIGIETKVFTHGAYLPADFGFPVQWGFVQIGCRVWLPNAWVNPGVIIGDNVVVAAKSLVNEDLPSGCFAAGIPARVMRIRCYPRETEVNLAEMLSILELPEFVEIGDITIMVCKGPVPAVFDVRNRTINGAATLLTEQIKDQLRRNGIRFKYMEKNGIYVPW